LWSYDQRAKVSSVEATGRSLARYEYGLAGLMRRRRALGTVTQEPEQTFLRQYDVRGRVVGETLAAGQSTLAHGDLQYSPDGDLLSFSIQDSVRSIPASTGMSFRYDALHRLI